MRKLLAICLALVACLSACATNGGRVTGPNSVVLTGEGKCESNLNGAYAYDLWSTATNWFRATEARYFNCTGPTPTQALPEEPVSGLRPCTEYAMRIAAYTNQGSGYFDSNGSSTAGEWDWFTTTCTTTITLADVGDENGTDAQAAVNATRAHLTLSWDRGSARDDDPETYSIAWVDRPSCTYDPEPSPGCKWHVVTECRHAMRVWTPSGGGDWFRMFDRKFGEFLCKPTKLQGLPGETSSGAAARATFELYPKEKRWRNIRMASNCKRWEDSNGYDHLECTAFAGTTPPLIQ